MDQETTLSADDLPVLNQLDSRLFGIVKLNEDIHASKKAVALKAIRYLERRVESRQISVTDQTQAHIKLGHLHLLLEDWDQALTAYKKYSYFIRDLRFCKEPTVLYGIGHVSYQFCRYNEARAAFHQVLYVDPGFQRTKEVHMRLGIIARMSGDWETGRRHFLQVIIDPSVCSFTIAEIRFHVALLHDACGRLEEAAALYTALMEDTSLSEELRSLVYKQMEMMRGGCEASTSSESSSQNSEARSSSPTSEASITSLTYEASALSLTSEASSSSQTSEDNTSSVTSEASISSPGSPRGSAPLPELSWADRQKVWDLMAFKENIEMYKRVDVKTIMEHHPDLKPWMRSVLVNWIFALSPVHKLLRETTHLAIDFVDRFLGVSSAPVPKNKLQLLGISCLFIAAKIEEMYPPTIQLVSSYTGGSCTVKEIGMMEMVVMESLDWGLAPMTTNAWMLLYMQIHYDVISASLDENFSTQIKDGAVSAIPGAPFSRAMQLVDLCLMDVASLEFKYSVLAASALCYTVCDQGPSPGALSAALRVSGYTWPDIAPCFQWMTTFFSALTEGSSLLQTALLSLNTEDSLHVQPHCVDLQLLKRAQDLAAMGA